jgi:hypothetical protein
LELARSGRICIDIDAAVIMTLGPFGGRIKSRIVIFGHQFDDQRDAPVRARPLRSPLRDEAPTGDRTQLMLGISR